MPEAKRPTVLVVDDVAENIQILGDTLRNEYAVLAAKSGEKALETAARSLPDLILLDVMMPDMDGFETCRRMKQNKALKDIPVIFVTALTDAVNEAKGFAVGGVDYITKPVSPPIVRARVATHIRLRATETRLRDTLQKTLAGAVSLFMDLLILSNPVAYSRASRLKHYVKLMLPHLDRPGAWQFELAAMFSQVGCLSIPPDILQDIYAGRSVEDSDRVLFDLHPQAGCELVGRIPNLESVAAIIARQEDDPCSCSEHEKGESETVALGACVLRTILAYDRLVTSGQDREMALGQLKANTGEYESEVVAALEKGLQTDEWSMKPRKVFASLLMPGYILQTDAVSSQGKLLLKAGTELSAPMIHSLQRIAANACLEEPLAVLTPE
ncbi:response regulator [Desulfomicrobium escambiense]|uniref:response regulator n=1 Tax=Desulfomicrobium escambiense TaxID=29503 RepID=UPI00042848BD|nr:response regulator [Desulfomicrobium escambiense]